MKLLRIYKPDKPVSLFNKIVPAFAIFAVLVVSLALDPDETAYPSCVFKSITGYDCPSCGLTRSFYSMSHLGIAEAFQYHLMGPVLYIVLFLLLLKFSYESFFRKEIRINTTPRTKKIIFLALTVIWLTFWLSKFR